MAEDGVRKDRHPVVSRSEGRVLPAVCGPRAGVVGEPGSPGEVALRAGERLVNLTGHDVMLVARPRREGDGVGESSLACIPPDGRFARVDDEAARLRERLLDTDSGVVRLTWLRRSGRLAGLPRPRAGTRYLVPRVTALAARDRKDLVFPFGEIRDEHGRVTGARGLASFRPRPVIWRLPAAWRSRRWRAFLPMADSRG